MAFCCSSLLCSFMVMSSWVTWPIKNTQNPEAAATRPRFLVCTGSAIFPKCRVPARRENRICSHFCTGDATSSYFVAKNSVPWISMDFLKISYRLCEGSYTCDLHRALAMTQFSKKTTWSARIQSENCKSNYCTAIQTVFLSESLLYSAFKRVRPQNKRTEARGKGGWWVEKKRNPGNEGRGQQG